MEIFKIFEYDFSQYVSALKISTKTNYNAQTNAAGNTVIDKINDKRIVEVGIIPLNEADANLLLQLIANFQVNIWVRNPADSSSMWLQVFIAESDIEYYTIQADKVMLKAFNLKFTEL
jgi:hypothetical protein